MVGAIEFATYSLLSQAREDEGDLCAAFVLSLSFPLDFSVLFHSSTLSMPMKSTFTG